MRQPIRHDHASDGAADVGAGASMRITTFAAAANCHAIIKHAPQALPLKYCW
jgi:hypothetical protein